MYEKTICTCIFMIYTKNYEVCFVHTCLYMGCRWYNLVCTWFILVHAVSYLENANLFSELAKPFCGEYEYAIYLHGFYQLSQQPFFGSIQEVYPCMYTMVNSFMIALYIPMSKVVQASMQWQIQQWYLHKIRGSHVQCMYMFIRCMYMYM